MPSGFATDDTRENADHLKDVHDGTLVEREDRQPALYELRGDVGLEIREGEDEIGLERFYFVEARRNEGRDFWLAARFRRPERVAGDTGHAVALAEQIEGLGRLLGQTDDAFRICRQRRTHRGQRSRQPRS